jgi:hypothetical protein
VAKKVVKWQGSKPAAQESVKVSVAKQEPVKVHEKSIDK